MIGADYISDPGDHTHNICHRQNLKRELLLKFGIIPHVSHVYLDLLLVTKSFFPF